MVTLIVNEIRFKEHRVTALLYNVLSYNDQCLFVTWAGANLVIGKYIYTESVLTNACASQYQSTGTEHVFDALIINAYAEAAWNVK